MSLRNIIEKTPIQSKKFLAYMISSLIGKSILVFMIINAVSPGVIAWSVTCLSFLDIGYILSTASLDLFVRLAHIKHIDNVK